MTGPQGWKLINVYVRIFSLVSIPLAFKNQQVYNTQGNFDLASIQDQKQDLKATRLLKQHDLKPGPHDFLKNY